MKKKLLALALSFAMVFGLTTAVSADTTPTIVADASDELVISDLTLDAFEGMAPGDSRTETILVKNDSSSIKNFYISAQTLIALEETNKAAGGAYEFQISVGANETEAESLLEKIAGGYDTDGTASEDGLSDITELSEESVLFASLNPGEYTYLFINLTLNGEGNDRTEAEVTTESGTTVESVGYANAIGMLQFKFSMDTITHQEAPKVVQRVHQIITTNPVYRYVSTGDHWTYLIYFGVLLAGIAVILVGMNKRKKAKED